MNIFEKRFISRFESNLEEFNLSSLGNKLALKTEWSPLGTNGTYCAAIEHGPKGANGPTITFQATITGYIVHAVGRSRACFLNTNDSSFLS